MRKVTLTRDNFNPIIGLDMQQYKLNLPVSVAGVYGPVPFSLENGYSRAIKPVLDSLISIAALTVLFFPGLLIFFAVLIDSRGKPFFSQNRVGRNGGHFRMFKFRTMRHNAELEFHRYIHLNERTGPVFKLKNDPRVTALGRLLRKLSIDEIPQFYNVLQGNMSLIGPRPPIVWEVRHYDSVSMLRLGTKPGITGLWQVSGRAEMSFSDMVELDIRYIINCSIVDDIQIMFKTLPAVFSGRGAC